MRFSEQFLAELKYRSEIVAVVAEYINLKQIGKNKVGLCPFHNEKTPSFYVYPESESFYCFGCGIGGDVITFVEKIENLSYLDAVGFLAKRAGVAMPDDQDSGVLKIRERIFAVNRAAAKFFYNFLFSKDGKRALEYLKSRGLAERTIRRFGLGFAPIGRFELCDHLVRKGFNKSELVAANLAFLNKNGNVFDRFFERVMFPIIDLRGNVVAFGGRALASQIPKYLNTSDTAVFKKSSNLFALNFAKSSSEDSFLLTEGYMDVIALHQAGFCNAIATLGTALTLRQAQIISRYTKKVIICYDADKAGQKAAERAITLLRDVGLLVKVLTFPHGKDPDEFIKSFGKEGEVRFKQLINNSKNDVEYRLQKISDIFDKTNADGKIGYLKEAIKVLSLLDNKIEQEIYAGKLAQEVNVQKVTVLQQIKRERERLKKINLSRQMKNIQKDISVPTDKINPEKSKFLRAAKAEEALLSYIIYHPDEAKSLADRLPPESFCTKFNMHVYESLLKKIEKTFQITIGDFSEEFPGQEMGRITKFFVNNIAQSETKESLDEYINVIISEKNKITIQDAATKDLTEIVRYLETIKSLKGGRN